MLPAEHELAPPLMRVTPAARLLDPPRPHASRCIAAVSSRPASIPDFVPKQRVELDIGHVGLCDVGDVAASTFARGPLGRRLVVRHRMMPESEEAPVVCTCKALAVFNRHV